MTLQKDRSNNEATQRRINVRKILSLDDMINKPYSKVIIELDKNYDKDEIKSLFKQSGDTQIDLIFNDNNRKIYYILQNARKFDFNHLKILKNKEYVKKITV